MALGAGSAWPTAVDADSTLGPTSGILAGVTHLGDTGTGQGDLLGIIKNLIQAEVKIENVAQCGGLWCVANGTFTQPAIGSTVTVTVYSAPYGTTPFSQGMMVYAQPGLVGGNVGGLYLVTAVGSTTSITIMNMGGPNNVASGTVLPTATVIQFLGWANEGPSDSVALYERIWENSETFTSGNNPNNDWTVTLANSGTFASDNTAADATGVNTPSLWQANANGATNSSIVVSPKNIFIPSGTALDIAYSVFIPTLSTNTNTFVTAVGISTSSTAAGSSPFMGLICNTPTNTPWEVSTGATYTTNLTTTGVNVVAGTLYHLRVTLNSGWTSMTCYVNHGNATTVTSNLQTGQMFLVFIVNSSAGTANKVVNWARTKTRLYLSR